MGCQLTRHTHRKLITAHGTLHVALAGVCSEVVTCLLTLLVWSEVRGQKSTSCEYAQHLCLHGYTFCIKGTGPA